MITEQEAEEICEELGFTLSEAEQSHERVNEYVATLYLEEEIQTVATLPSGSSVYRHQLVVGPDGHDYIILEMNQSAVQIAEVVPPGPENNSVGFLGTRAITFGRLQMEYEPQFASDGHPIWAY